MAEGRKNWGCHLPMGSPTMSSTPLPALARMMFWLGRQRGGLTHLRYSGNSFTAKTYTQADGLAQKQGVRGLS